MDAKTLQKYNKKSVPQLMKLATDHFNLFIRERDKENGCISCPRGQVENAGHYYSGGHYPELRFNENNVNGQCIRCNKHEHGNLLEYRKGLEKKIGAERLQKLDDTVAYYKRHPWHWDRFALIEIITSYKQANVQKEIKEKTCIQEK